VQRFSDRASVKAVGAVLVSFKARAICARPGINRIESSD